MRGAPRVHPSVRLRGQSIFLLIAVASREAASPGPSGPRGASFTAPHLLRARAAAPTLAGEGPCRPSRLRGHTDHRMSRGCLRLQGRHASMSSFRVKCASHPTPSYVSCFRAASKNIASFRHLALQASSVSNKSKFKTYLQPNWRKALPSVVQGVLGNESTIRKKQLIFSLR